MGKFLLIWFREIMERAISLDAFRGFAIIIMVLSGTIASNVLPAWMYHAQVELRSNYNFDPYIWHYVGRFSFSFFLIRYGSGYPILCRRQVG